MNWRVGAPPINRHIDLRLDDLNDVNRDLLAATKELIEVAESIPDQDTARRVADEVRKLADLSRRLSLATRSIAHTTVALLEAT